jgi:hypothetical protein
VALPDARTKTQLAALRSLLALTIVLGSELDEGKILRLAEAPTGSLATSQIDAIYVDGQRRTTSPHIAGTGNVGDLDRRVALLRPGGGSIKVPGREWGWAFSLTARAAPLGFCVAGGAARPDATERLILRALGQHIGLALASSRMHAQALRFEADLQRSNQALRSNILAHDRLTKAAAGGEGLSGIAVALCEVTGLRVAIQDRPGNLLAWSGPGQWDTYPKQSATDRERLLAQLEASAHPLRHKGYLISLARPRSDVVGTIALVDPSASSGGPEWMALEHAAVLVSTELIRMASVVDTELRLGRDLLGELLAGTTEPATRSRLVALGCDPDDLQVVAVIEGRSRAGDTEVFRQMVRRAAHDHDIGGLFTPREDDVVLICPRDRAWQEFHAGVMLLLPAGECRVGVGGPCRGIPDLPRSHHEARLAMNIQRIAGGQEQVTVFESLGVYRLLGGLDTSAVENIVGEWLGPLLEYDAKRHTQLTRTLSVYLASGRHYEGSAHSLSVHPSTLKYRLRRIRELTGHDLNEPETQFNLQVATRAWNTMQAIRAADPPARDV